ncbi:MAG: GNAT family N-acetyltransferase [Candidatus Thorarchaeota archaeon]
MIRKITHENFSEIDALFDDLIKSRQSTEHTLRETVKDDVFNLLSNGQAQIYVKSIGSTSAGLVMYYPEDNKIGIIHVDSSLENSQEIKRNLFDVAFVELSKSNPVVRCGAPSVDPKLWEYMKEKGFQRFDRKSMIILRNQIESIEITPLPEEIQYDIYEPEMRPAIAKLIYDANIDQIDSITYPDHFASEEGSLRFVEKMEETDYHPYSKILRLKDEYIGLCFIVMHSEESGYISELCIGKNYQGNGLGRSLLALSLQDLARDTDRLESVSLDVTLGNPVKKLYDSLSFKDKREFTVYTFN